MNKKVINRNQNNRDSNIELLRLFLMLCIVLHHTLVYGEHLNKLLEATSTSSFYIVIDSLCIGAVNCFVFISGFYTIQLRYQSVIKFLVQITFFSVSIYCFSVILGDQVFTIKALVKSFIPIQTGTWWFISVYFYLILLSPLLNQFKLLSNEFQITVLLALWGINSFEYEIFKQSYWGVNDGYSILSFVAIYITALFLSEKTYMTFFSRHALKLLGFAYFFILIGLFITSSFHFPQKNWNVFSYNNPFVLLFSIGLFFMFKRLSIIFLSSTSFHRPRSVYI